MHRLRGLLDCAGVRAAVDHAIAADYMGIRSRGVSGVRRKVYGDDE